MRKYLTAKAMRRLDAELASEMLDADADPAGLDPMGGMLSATLDLATAREMAGLGLPPVDPLTGLVLDAAPDLVAERSGLEELDVREIRRHRYDGQYPGEPETHFLGGSNEITFGDDSREITESWTRVRDHSRASDRQKAWREAYHQMGFIASWLNLPEPVKEDVCRAYADLREQEISEAYSLERLLGLLTYVACGIHDYPRDFDDVRKAIDELYGLSISRNDVTSSMVRAFNKGSIRFGVNNQNGYQYLHTWKMVNSEKVGHRSLGRL